MTRLPALIVVALIAIVVVVKVIKADPAAKHCEDEAGINFEGWEKWTPITPNPVISSGHGNMWVKIYVNKIAEATYLSADAPYPECSKIVKPLYSDAEGKSIDKLTIMVKMASGYDSANGDWWYALYDGPGTKVRKQGRLYSGCIICHKQAAESDYLFSEDVLKAAEE